MLTIDEFRQQYVHIIMPEDQAEQWLRADMVHYYWTKYRIAATLKPHYIVEIGVRAGYSAWSFLLACPQARFLGIDPYLPIHGGVEESMISQTRLWAERLINPCDSRRIVCISSQNLDALDDAPDFVHVDGDHGRAGAFRDMQLALGSISPTGAILVDDFEIIGDVRHAVREFL